MAVTVRLRGRWSRHNRAKSGWETQYELIGAELALILRLAPYRCDSKYCESAPHAVFQDEDHSVLGRAQASAHLIDVRPI